MASKPLSSIRARLWLYFIKRLHACKGGLPLNVVREACLYLVGDVMLPFKGDDTGILALVCPATLQVKKVSIEKRVMGQCYCLMDYRRVFYLQGPEEGDSMGNAPRVLETDSLETRELGAMTKSRSFPTVLLHKDHVYIFSGCRKSCEKLSIWNLQFAALRSRAPFSFYKSQACVCSNYCYIAPLRTHSLLQFDFETEVFTEVSKSPLTSLTALMLALDSEVLLFDSFYVARWSGRGENTMESGKGNLLQFLGNERSWRLESGEESAISLSCPVKVGSRTYFFSGWTASGDGVRLTVFDEKTKSIEQKTFD